MVNVYVHLSVCTNHYLMRQGNPLHKDLHESTKWQMRLANATNAIKQNKQTSKHTNNAKSPNLPISKSSRYGLSGAAGKLLHSVLRHPSDVGDTHHRAAAARVWRMRVVVEMQHRFVAAVHIVGWQVGRGFLENEVPVTTMRKCKEFLCGGLCRGEQRVNK